MNGPIMENFKLKLNVFETQQQTEEKQSEFSALNVEQQNELLGRSINGKTYLKGEATFEGMEWFQKQEMPSDAQITRSVEESYRKMNGRQIGWNERIKAKREFKKKHKTMKKMRQNLREQMAESVQKDLVVKDITQQDGVAEIRDEYNLLDLYQPEEQKQMREFMSAKVITTYTQPKQIAQLTEEQKLENKKNMQKKAETFKDTIERFEKLDISDLTFTSLEDLVQRAPMMRRKAMIGFVMRKFVDNEYLANGGELSEERKMKLWLKIDAMESVIALADMAIDVYASPYYACFRSSTLDKMTIEQLEAINDDPVGVPQSMIRFIDGLLGIKRYVATGGLGDYHESPAPGESMESLMERMLVRRDIIGYAEDPGTKSNEQLEQRRTPEQNVQSILTLKKQKTTPDWFGEEGYALYKRARVQNPQIRHPELAKLLNTGKQYHGETMEISRVAGALFRHVEYDQKWQPVTEQDRANHEWNLQYATRLSKLAGGDASEEGAMNDMVREELLKNPFLNFDFPDPSVLDDLVKCIEEKKELSCAWIDDMLHNHLSELADAAQRALCYSNAMKLFPEEFKKLEKDHPFMSNYSDGAGSFLNLIGYYTSAKYGVGLDAYSNAKPEAAGRMLLQSPELIQSYIEIYRNFYNACKAEKQG
ncbi:MAG: hypothetical protein IKR61_05170 [Lachnospiraceae bacterium]|nr:hypothetical protein [Lachnospiraceae bacterium]